MNSRKLMLMAGALIFAAICAVMARSLVLGSAAAPAVAAALPPAGPEILVAIKPLPVGTIIGPDALRYQSWPGALVEKAYFQRGQQSPQTLVGTVVRYPITAGQPITQGALIKPGDRGFLAAALGPGMRAVTISVSAQSGVAGFVFPGDRVDLLLTQSVAGGGDGVPLRAAETIVRNIRVLATDQRTDKGTDDAGKTPVVTASNVTLETTPKLAEKIAVAQTIGALSLSLRSIADDRLELERAIAAGEVSVSDSTDPKAQRQLMLQVASRPIDTDPTFTTGAEVSRFQRATVPSRAAAPAAPAPAGQPAAVAAAPRRSGVEIVRGSVMGFPGGGVLSMRMSQNAPARGAILIAALAAGTLASLPVPAKAAEIAKDETGALAKLDATQTITLSTGTAQMVRLPRPMASLFVADDKVADVQVKSPTQLYLFAKTAGETSVYATDKAGDVIWASGVRVGNGLTGVGAMLRQAMPDADITATPVGGMVMLTGTVASPKDVDEAERLAGIYTAGGQVLNRLKTATPLQVNLHVKIVEVSRSVAKTIGVNILNRDSGKFVFGIAQGNPGKITTLTNGLDSATGGSTGDTAVGFQQLAGTTLGIAGHLLGMDVLSTLQLAETDGLATTLAEPNLTALSGETASFLAGGEIPIPQSQGLGAVSVEYKQYGVSLSFTPVVLSNGQISLRVRPEVSQLSDAGSVKLNDFTIPALTTRRAETTVELGSGQSFVIGGLLQNSRNNTTSKAPFLGDLPILGALFRSNGFQKQETELMIVVTPYLVRPVDAKQIVLPTDGYRAPTALGRVLLDQSTSPTSGAPRPAPIPAPAAPAGQ